MPKKSERSCEGDVSEHKQKRRRGAIPTATPHNTSKRSCSVVLYFICARIIKLGQAKLIASFPFQGFQNMMRAGGHYSL